MFIVIMLIWGLVFVIVSVDVLLLELIFNIIGVLWLN